MTLIVRDLPRCQLKPEDIEPWRNIPTAVISDELNRLGTMDAGIKPLRAEVKIVGPAFTVHTMAADNLALHYAVSNAPQGVILVIDAGGFMRNAVWGGILQRAAELRGIAGIVVDGCVRDAAELRKSPVPSFARGIVPAGPHKGWGGNVNNTIQCGGCIINPGDLVVGDADGVAIIPADQVFELLVRCESRMAAEKEILRKLEGGSTTVEILHLDAFHN